MKRAYCVVCFLVAPASFAAAQSTISGVVKDTSGAAVPGAAVEAASGVLIETARTAITNVEGQYGIIDLSVLGLVKNVT